MSFAKNAVQQPWEINYPFCTLHKYSTTALALGSYFPSTLFNFLPNSESAFSHQPLVKGSISALHIRCHTTSDLKHKVYREMLHSTSAVGPCVSHMGISEGMRQSRKRGCGAVSLLFRTHTLIQELSDVAHPCVPINIQRANHSYNTQLHVCSI